MLTPSGRSFALPNDNRVTTAGGSVAAALARMDPLEERFAWLRWRRDGIGGSDIAGLLNMSRFSSPMSIYLDKRGMLADDDGNEAMLWGRLLEEPIAREFAARAQLQIIGEQIIACNAERPWERCTVDVLVSDTITTNLDAAIGVAEIKNSADFGWDAIPDEYAVQVQWQLGICEIEHGWLVVLHGGRRLAVYEIGFDPIVFGDLRATAERFWHDNVLAENPPRADGDSATTDALKDAYRELADGTTVELSTDCEALAVAWLHAKERCKVEKQRRDRIENQLRAELAESTVGARAGVELVTWKPQGTAARFDTVALERDHPIIAAAYRGEPGTTRVLRPTKALREKAGIA